MLMAEKHSSLPNAFISQTDDDHRPEFGEKEYDALNDETFNQAISDDWEGMNTKYENEIQLEMKKF
jgi:hypothetical protein